MSISTSMSEYTRFDLQNNVPLALANVVLEEIGEADSTGEQCLRIMTYLSEALLISEPAEYREWPGIRRAMTDRKDQPSLMSGWGDCHVRALAFVALCRADGIPARQVTIVGLNHSAAEAFYDGQWHFFDPTYGFVFWHAGALGVLSLEDLQHSPKCTLMQSTRNLWTGVYRGEVKLRTVPGEWCPPNGYPGGITDYRAWYVDGMTREGNE